MVCPSVSRMSVWNVRCGGSRTGRETEESGNRPRKEGEKGVNFLSVKTPLERER